MDEKQVKKIADQAISDYMRNKQYNLSKIPSHEHNGTDTIKIKENNLINGPKYTAFVQSNTDEDGSVNRIYFPNISSIRVYGFIANATPTVRATINGEAQFGAVSLTSGNITVPVQNGIIQCTNSICIDINTINNTRVSASNEYLAYPIDSSGTGLVEVRAVNWTPNSVDIEVKNIRNGYTLNLAVIIT
jgi:hypothetical protein